ncbi:MAG: energy transducer TonB [Sphingomonas bacterium]|nr:energy transducer TonB [Sphingomonas bacterium]
MIGVMLGVLAGGAFQPAIVRPPMMTAPVTFTAPLAPLPDGAAPAVRASAHLPSLFSKDDYPAAALRDEEQGTVSFAVAINRDGRVTQCSITTSSGSISLDLATCSIIQRRARFSPARDASGRTVEDRADARIRWELPPAPPIPFANQKIGLVFTVETEGGVSECRVEGTAIAPNKDALCAAMMSEAGRIAAAAAKKFDLTNRELVLEQGLLIGGPDSARSVGRGPDETRGTLFALALEIDPAGVIVKCTATGDGLDSARVYGGCKDSRKRSFVALDPAAGDQTTRHAVRYWASYTRPIE